MPVSKLIQRAACDLSYPSPTLFSKHIQLSRPQWRMSGARKKQRGRNISDSTRLRNYLPRGNGDPFFEYNVYRYDNGKIEEDATFRNAKLSFIYRARRFESQSSKSFLFTLSGFKFKMMLPKPVDVTNDYIRSSRTLSMNHFEFLL